MKSKTTEKAKTWYTFDEVVKEASRSPVFRKEYEQESARLRLAIQIRKARLAKKMTQKSTARKAGMPQSVIARIEGGTHGMSVDTLERIAHTLGKKVQLV